MYVVITGCFATGFNFFGPFDDREEAESWAREYKTMHGTAVDVISLSKPWDLDHNR